MAHAARGLRHLALVVSMAFPAAACSPSAGYRASVASAGHGALTCPSDLILVRELGENQYAAEGCGHRQRYVCRTQTVGAARMIGGGMAMMTQSGCTPVGPLETMRRSHTPPGPSVAYSTTSSEDARAALGAIRDCPGVEREATLAITIGPRGDVQRVETPGVAVDVATCVVNALRGTSFGARAHAEVARVRLDPHPDSAASAPASGP